MADNGKQETALMIEGLYNGIAYDLQKLKKELKDEMSNSSKQVAAANEQLKAAVKENAELSSVELKYGYQQNQMIFEALSEAINAVAETSKAVEEKLAALDAIEKKVAAIDIKEPDYEEIAETVKEKLLGAMALPEEPDYDKVVEQVAEKTESSVNVHSKEVLDSIAAIPVPENVDYTRIVEEVSDKVMEKLSDFLATEFTAEKIQKFIPQEDKMDYDRVIYGTAEKVVESLPYPEKIDYDRIAPPKACNEDEFVEKIAAAVMAKIPAAQPIDYDLLADKVAQKIVIPVADAPEYDVVVDDDGIDKIATAVAEKFEVVCVPCEEESVEEPAPVEEPVEEPVVEEPVVEEPVEEPAEEPAPVEEIAVAEVEPEIDYDDESQLVDAEHGLVIRLKRSFTAKLKQSAPEIKTYFNILKNELDSYKRLNSNVSWHGARFNFGRETVAKMRINGKTLCFYLALDPANPEFKQTVYHQKDLSDQKAYEATPFMVKVKSETGAKRAVRLIAALAQKLGAVKNEKYEEVDYVNEFAYASTKELIDDGLIKVTKEKKVVLNFN